MTNKKNGGIVVEMTAPAPEQNALQAKLQSIHHVMKLAEMRKKCVEHLDALKEFKVTNAEIESDEQVNPLEKITLRFSDGSYEIKNPTLLQTIQNLMIFEFETRISQIETEIKAATI